MGATKENWGKKKRKGIKGLALGMHDIIDTYRYRDSKEHRYDISIRFPHIDISSTQK